jgi:hypothetical protein
MCKSALLAFSNALSMIREAGGMIPQDLEDAAVRDGVAAAFP